MTNRTDLCQARAQLQQLETDVRVVRDRIGSRTAATYLAKSCDLIAGARSLLTEALRQRVDTVVDTADMPQEARQ